MTVKCQPFPARDFTAAGTDLPKAVLAWFDAIFQTLEHLEDLIEVGNITQVLIRLHNDLQGIDGSGTFHFSEGEHDDLTDGGDSVLHFHATDRDRTNHTGTQIAATISDFTEAAQDVIGGSLADSPSIDFTYDDGAGTVTGTVIGKHEKTGFDVDSSGNYTSTLTYNETTRTVTITPTGASFDIYIQGVKHTKTTQSIVHAATGANHFVYFDATGTLVTSTTPWDVLLVAPACFVFQDETNSRRIPFEERHHAGRDNYWHKNQHAAEGTKTIAGFSISDITGYTLSTGTDAACTFAIASGTIADEDVQVVSEALPDNGPYNILERSGASGAWQLTRTNVVPFKRSGTVLQYNQNNAGTWQLTTVANGDHVNYYVFAVTALPVASITPSPTATQQIVIVPGQAKFTNLITAHGETVASISWGTIPFQEIVPIYKLIFKYSAAAGGTISLEQVDKIIGSAVSLSASVPTDHGSLSGLLDDDHTQYLITDGSRTVTSAALASAISDETGSGALVFATSPSLTTPTINTAASVGGAWTAAATWTLPAHTLGGTLTLGGQTMSGSMLVNGATTTTNATQLSHTNTAAAPVMVGIFGNLSPSGTVSATGLNVGPTFTPGGASLTNLFSILNTPTWNNAIAPTAITLGFNRLTMGAASANAVGTFLGNYIQAPIVTGGSTATITNYIANDVDDSALTHTLAAAYRGKMASGSGRWNAFMSGTASNAFAATTRFGSTVAPVAMVDVTGSVAATTTILSSGATSGIGYATGAGGTVTQATSKATGVTLNKMSGAITMNGAALAATTAVSFTLTNSGIAATDHVAVCIVSGATAGAYGCIVDAIAAGSCQISLRNNTAGSLSEAVVVRFTVFKGVSA